LGTLGGGNHFIEFQTDEEGFLWIMLHSGSRNFGLKAASAYHKMAQALCARWHVTLPDPDLAFLPMDDQAGQDYEAAMNFCLDFAQATLNKTRPPICLPVFRSSWNAAVAQAPTLASPSASTSARMAAGMSASSGPRWTPVTRRSTTPGKQPWPSGSLFSNPCRPERPSIPCASGSGAPSGFTPERTGYGHR
jgi:hypothetical protein